MEERRNRKRRRLVILAAVLLLDAWTLWGNTALMVHEIVAADDRLPAAFSGFRIAQISDLHNAEFGADNEKLLRMLAECEPDVIVITGDMVDSRSTRLEVALAFAAEAVRIAPVYYVTGNHEASIREYGELREGLLAAGVTVLEDQAVTLTRGGAEISLIGLSDPAFSRGNKAEKAAGIRAGLQKLTGGGADYAVVLAHRPEFLDAYAAGGADLVLSGHAHGGQFRLPLVGGLIAPGQGFFPRYDAGLYTSVDTQMVVSRGLGNSVIPLRINNRPEIVVVTLAAGE